MFANFIFSPAAFLHFLRKGVVSVRRLCCRRRCIIKFSGVENVFVCSEYMCDIMFLVI